MTVWWQVRVLPVPPAFARSASYGSAGPIVAKAAAPKPIGRRRAAARETFGQNMSGVAWAARKRRRTGAEALLRRRATVRELRLGQPSQ
jgi:hypothetical protein